MKRLLPLLVSALAPFGASAAEQLRGTKPTSYDFVYEPLQAMAGFLCAGR